MPRGVRLNPQHDEKTRAKIQTSQIINRLQSFVKGEVEMSASQVSAALGLLKKTLPDLTAVEHSGEVETRYIARLPEKSKDIDEWQKRHAPQPTMQ